MKKFLQMLKLATLIFLKMEVAETLTSDERKALGTLAEVLKGEHLINYRGKRHAIYEHFLTETVPRQILESLEMFRRGLLESPNQDALGQELKDYFQMELQEIITQVRGAVDVAINMPVGLQDKIEPKQVIKLLDKYESCLLLNPEEDDLDQKLKKVFGVGLKEFSTQFRSAVGTV